MITFSQKGMKIFVLNKIVITEQAIQEEYCLFHMLHDSCLVFWLDRSNCFERRDK